MKSRLAIMAVFGLASLGLSGCVVNVGDGESGWDNSESWEKVQDKNRQNLSRLNLGMTKDQVNLVMGEADFNEAYLTKATDSQPEKAVQVLFYRTQHVHSDGKTTKEECTPVVFRDSKLVGWGETAYQNM